MAVTHTIPKLLNLGDQDLLLWIGKFKEAVTDFEWNDSQAMRALHKLGSPSITQYIDTTGGIREIMNQLLSAVYTKDQFHFYYNKCKTLHLVRNEDLRNYVRRMESIIF